MRRVHQKQVFSFSMCVDLTGRVWVWFAREVMQKHYNFGYEYPKKVAPVSLQNHWKSLHFSANGPAKIKVNLTVRRKP